MSLSDGSAVLLSASAWVVASVLIGKVAARWPMERLEVDGPLTRLRGWEDGGRFWQRCGALRWKRWLPDAGRFGGGVTKAESLRSPVDSQLGGHSDGRGSNGQRSGARRNVVHLRAETVRAERVHWLIAATGLLHGLWCRPVVAAIMVLAGLVWNAPFIIVQRMNRGRVDRVLARRRAASE